MSRRFLQSAAILALAAAPTPADTVRLTGRPAFRNVRVTDLRAGRLVLQGVSQQVLRKPITHVEALSIDGFLALNRAEQAAADGRWTEAVPDYELALREAGGGWRAELVRCRLLRAHNRAGHFDQAVALYADLLRRGSVAADLAPDRPGPRGSAANRAALACLARHLGDRPPAPIAAALRQLHLQLSIYEELTEGMQPPAQPASAPATPPHAANEPSPEAAGDAPRPDRAGILPPLDPTPPAPPPDSVRLPPDSFILRAAEEALAAGDVQRAHRLVAAALPHVEPGGRPAWQLLAGRCRLELGERAEAAADLVRLAESDSDPARVATALYYVGLAYERMGRHDAARTLYQDVLRRSEAPEEMRTRAEQALEALRP